MDEKERSEECWCDCDREAARRLEEHRRRTRRLATAVEVAWLVLAAAVLAGGMAGAVALCWILMGRPS